MLAQVKAEALELAETLDRAPNIQIEASECDLTAIIERS